MNKPILVSTIRTKTSLSFVFDYNNPFTAGETHWIRIAPVELIDPPPELFNFVSTRTDYQVTSETNPITITYSNIKPGDVGIGYYSAFNIHTGTSESATELFFAQTYKYDITYVVNGGFLPAEEIPYFFATGDLPLTLPTPTKADSDFGGWYTDAGFVNEMNIIPTGTETNITIYAKWNVTITFESNEGTAVSPLTQAFGKAITEPPEPTKDDSTFGGWYEDEGLTTEFLFTTMPEQHLTLYALWLGADEFRIFKDKIYINGKRETFNKVISTGLKTVELSPTYTYEITWVWDNQPLSGLMTVRAVFYDRFGNLLGSQDQDMGVLSEAFIIDTTRLPYRKDIVKVGFSMWITLAGLLVSFSMMSIAIVDDYGGTPPVGDTTDFEFIFTGEHTITDTTNNTSTFDLDSDFYRGRSFITNTKEIGISPNYMYKLDYDITWKMFDPPEGIDINMWLSALFLDENGELLYSTTNIFEDDPYTLIDTIVAFVPKTGTFEIDVSTFDWKEDVKYIQFLFWSQLWDTDGLVSIIGDSISSIREFRLQDDFLTYHKITFDFVDDTVIEMIQEGLTIQQPIDPVRAGFIFVNWYADSAYNTLFDFDTPIMSDTTIYAKWLDISDNLIVQINGEVVEVDESIKLELSRLEERDYGEIFVQTSRKERYEMYDIVDITIYGMSYQFLVQRDTPTQINATQYEHKITLMEVISIFDTITPFDRSFSKVPAYRVGEILQTYAYEMDNYHNLTVDFGFNADYVKPLPQREYLGQNMSVILTDIFRSFNAIPRCMYNHYTKAWEVYPEYYNQRNTLITPNPESYQGGLDTLEYATSIKSQLKNSMYENDKGIWFPSATGFVTPRSNGIIFRESEARFELDSDILAIFEVIVHNVPVIPFEEERIFIDIDITEQVVDQEVYDHLEPMKNSTSAVVLRATNNKRNCLRYTRGTPYIEGLYEKASGFLGFSVNIDIWLNAIKKAYFDKYATHSGDIIDTGYDEVKMMEVRFRYLPARDVEFTVEKYDQRGMNQSTVYNRQNTSSVEISRYKENVTNIVNMMGNEGIRFQETFGYHQRRYELGDYTADGLIISKVSYMFENKNVTVHGVLNKNFINTQSEYAISRIPSPYTITQKRAQTTVIVKNYIEISETQKANTGDLAMVGLNILWNAFARYNNEYANKETAFAFYNLPITSIILVPMTEFFDEAGVLGVHMNMLAGGDGTVMTVHGAFEHQLVAGYRLEYDTDDSIWYKKPVNYTDDEGMLESFKMYWVGGHVNFGAVGVDNPADEYPLANIYAVALNKKNKIYRVDLDGNASLGITAEFHVTSDEPDQIVAPCFAKYCNLIRKFDEMPTIEIYVSNRPYTILDRQRRDTDTLATAISISVNYDVNYNYGLTITNTQGAEYIALCINQEVVIAVNGLKASRTLYFNNKGGKL